MGYCTVAEVMGMLKEDIYNLILSDDTIYDEDDRRHRMEPLTRQAIEDADAEIDGYLAKRYSIPFDGPPKILNKIGKDIAVYNLVSRVGIDENDRDKTFLKRYEAAIRFLEAVAKGQIELGVNNPKELARTGFQSRSPKRVFSRDSLRGW